MTSPRLGDEPAGPAPSLARSSTMRFGAEVIWAGCALFTGAAVGRQLGPDGKGVAALLGYLVAVVGPLCSLGLGEASATFVRQGAIDLRSAVRASMGAVILSSIVGMVALVALAIGQFHGRDLYRQLDGSILVAALTVPVLAVSQVLTLLIESQHRLATTSVARILVGAVTAASTALLIFTLHRGVVGVMLGSVIGFGAGAVFLAVRLALLGAAPIPAVQPDYVRRAVRVGLPIQLAFVLVGLSARADMLVVQWFKGGTQTGLYSVAITVSQLVMFAPVAIAAASFPVIAGLHREAVGSFVDRLIRTSTLVAVLVAAVVAATAPLVIPAAFGLGFRPAVGTTLLLLPSAILGALQWIVSRAAAARGSGRLVLRSYIASTVVMLLADVLTVPWGGRNAAAVAAAAGSATGVAVALRGYRSISSERHLLRRTLVPHRGDLRLLLDLPMRILRPRAASPISTDLTEGPR